MSKLIEKGKSIENNEIRAPNPQKRGILYDPEEVDGCVKLFSENKFKFE